MAGTPTSTPNPWRKDYIELPDGTKKPLVYKKVSIGDHKAELAYIKDPIWDKTKDTLARGLLIEIALQASLLANTLTLAYGIYRFFIRSETAEQAIQKASKAMKEG